MFKVWKLLLIFAVISTYITYLYLGSFQQYGK